MKAITATIKEKFCVSCSNGTVLLYIATANKTYHCVSLFHMMDTVLIQYWYLFYCKVFCLSIDVSVALDNWLAL